MGHLDTGLLDLGAQVGEGAFQGVAGGRELQRSDHDAGPGVGEQVGDERAHVVGGPHGTVDEVQRLFVEMSPAGLLDQLEVALDGHQRRLQVVGHDVAEGLELGVRAFQTGSLLVQHAALVEEIDEDGDLGAQHPRVEGLGDVVDRPHLVAAELLVELAADGGDEDDRDVA